MQRMKSAGLAVVLGVIASTVSMTTPVAAHDTGIHDNCTNLNKKWPHGVGTPERRRQDHRDPGHQLHRNNDAYWRAERHNCDLDRDNDRIACEKR